MNISIERLAQIEQERANTLSDPGFREWARSLNVSRAFVNPEGKLRAREMMSLWTGRDNSLNSFSSVISKVVGM